MLMTILYMYFDAGATDIQALLNHKFDAGLVTLLAYEILGGAQTLIWLAFFASFAAKMSMWRV